MLRNRHQSTTKKLSWTWQDAGKTIRSNNFFFLPCRKEMAKIVLIVSATIKALISSPHKHLCSAQSEEDLLTSQSSLAWVF